MYWIHTIAVLCLLVLLDNAESLKLSQDGSRLNKYKDLARLKKHPGDLKASTSITRQSHICTIDCDFQLSFNDPLVLPNDCDKITTNYACEMIATIDYASKQIFFYSYSSSESLTIDNTTYDSATTHIALFEYMDNAMYHLFDYTCANGDDCEWVYMKEIIPKLILLNYQPLYDSTLPLVHNAIDQPVVTECYDMTGLVNCSIGACWFLKSVDTDHNLETLRNCADFAESSVEVGKVQYSPRPAKYDYDVLTFTCNKKQCNGPSNVLEMNKIISSKGNEYISSTQTSTSSTQTPTSSKQTSTSSSEKRFQLINLYLLGFTLMNLLFCKFK
jgi:hypothetical protein